MKDLLFLEDDEELNKGICIALSREGYKITGCLTITEAKACMQERQFDMLILDANLPDGNGFRLCREIRQNSDVPIILLTARGMDCDMVDGLDSGADDYIVKPVGIRVRCAHIQALFRRTVSQMDSRTYRNSRFNFEFETMRFFKNGILLELSRREQKLLHCLVMNANITLTRDKIMDYVWENELIYVEDNALAVMMKRLREKLEDDSARPQYIKTVYGLGYKWVDKECC